MYSFGTVWKPNVPFVPVTTVASTIGDGCPYGCARQLHRLTRLVARDLAGEHDRGAVDDDRLRERERDRRRRPLDLDRPGQARVERVVVAERAGRVERVRVRLAGADDR